MSAPETLRKPPSSQEAEQALIGAIMADNKLFDEAATIVSSDDFYHQEHRAIWSAMKALSSKGRAIDALLLADQLEVDKAEFGGAEYLRAVSESYFLTGRAKSHAEVIREKSMQRKLISIADSISSMSWEAGSSTEKIAKASEMIDGLVAGAQSTGPKKLRDLLPGRLQRVEDYADGKAARSLKTGLSNLDRRLSGGLRDGHVYIIAARPSIGKSSIAQAIGLSVAKAGHPVLMLSQEMPNEEVADRALSNVGFVDYESLQTGEMKDEDWNRLAPSASECADLPFFIDDKPSLTLPDIRTKVRQVKGLRLLIVDYLQLCASDEKRDNRNAEVEQISRGLKALAKIMKMPIIVLSQLNRKVEDRNPPIPIPADLRDSGAIEQDADVILLLWKHKEHSDGQKTIGCRIGKNRQGMLGDLPLRFEGRYQRWYESQESLEPEKKTKGKFE